MPQISFKRHLRSALFAVQQFNQADALFHLNLALDQADSTQVRSIRSVLQALVEKDWGRAQGALLEFLPPEEIEAELFLVNCSSCRAATGLGGLGKKLQDNAFIHSSADEALIDFILEGRRGTAMDGFARSLSREDVAFVISLLRSWQEQEVERPLQPCTDPTTVRPRACGLAQFRFDEVASQAAPDGWGFNSIERGRGAWATERSGPRLTSVSCSAVPTGMGAGYQLVRVLDRGPGGRPGPLASIARPALQPRAHPRGYGHLA